MRSIQTPPFISPFPYHKISSFMNENAEACDFDWRPVSLRDLFPSVCSSAKWTLWEKKSSHGEPTLEQRRVLCLSSMKYCKHEHKPPVQPGSQCDVPLKKFLLDEVAFSHPSLSRNEIHGKECSSFPTDHQWSSKAILLTHRFLDQQWVCFCCNRTPYQKLRGSIQREWTFTSGATPNLKFKQVSSENICCIPFHRATKSGKSTNDPHFLH